MDELLLETGLALAACPTAPGHEHRVRGWLQNALEGLPHVSTRLDEFGNLYVRYEHNAEGREPVRLVAHMDHPGFAIHRTNDQVEICFRGGVEEHYFRGKAILFYHELSDEPLGRALIEGTDFTSELKRVQINSPIPPDATFATWELSRTRHTSRLFISPTCDDLIQVATITTLLRRLTTTGASACVEALFTRAEEVGFYGALTALKSHSSLTPMITLSLEASSARDFAKLHAGPIIRVGDRLSLFDSRITHWLETAFRELQTRQSEIIFQRLLMSGGTCEGSVFHRAGLPTGALCVAMNSYHNMGLGHTLRSESISLSDWTMLCQFLFFLVTEAKSLVEDDQAVAERFSRLEAKALATLKGASAVDLRT